MKDLGVGADVDVILGMRMVMPIHGLLQALAGSLVSLYGRRMMCLLDVFFDACRGRRVGDVISLPPPLLDELCV